MKIMFSVLEKTNTFYRVSCGSNTNWIMQDLKTIKGYLNRLKKSHYWKNNSYILMEINDSVCYVLVNGNFISRQDAPKYIQVLTFEGVIRSIPTSWKSA